MYSRRAQLIRHDPRGMCDTIPGDHDNEESSRFEDATWGRFCCPSCVARVPRAGSRDSKCLADPLSSSCPFFSSARTGPRRTMNTFKFLPRYRDSVCLYRVEMAGISQGSSELYRIGMIELHSSVDHERYQEVGCRKVLGR